MLLNLGNIFKKSPVSASEQDVITPEHSNCAPESGVTYKQWGMSICAATTGSVYALDAYLQGIYNHICQQQENDQRLQQDRRRSIQLQVVQKENELDGYKTQLEVNQRQRNDSLKSVADLKAEITKIKAAKSVKNKDAMLKLII